MSTAASSSREARRRRIVERGSDRFALITGRAHLPSSPSAAVNPPSDPSLAPFDSCLNEDNGSATLLSNNDLGVEIGQRYTGVGPSMPKVEMSVEASVVPDLDFASPDQISQVSPTFPVRGRSASEAEPFIEPQTRRYSFCTPKQISSAVSASESSRIHCAVAAAVLVVFAYIGIHTLGNTILKNIILFRPLYLLLLTNISIVAAHILEDQQTGPQRNEQRVSNTPSDGGFGLAQLGDALEIGLMLQKVMGALFMDCSIYSVIVVCGISLAKRLGW